jgi:hypothetical protein
MSESSSESCGDYINGSPSPATRRNLLFLDMELSLPDDTSFPDNLLLETPSQSARSSDPGDPFPFTSTPELYFAASSSSPYLSPAKDRPFLHSVSTHLPGADDIRFVNPASDHASFGRHLDVLLRGVVEQENISKISGNARIQPEQIVDYKPRIVSTVCDTSSDLVISKSRGSRSFPLLHQEWRQLSLPDGGDPGGCVYTVAPHDASSVPTRTKRKALATIDEGLNIAVDFHECLPRRSDSYLSASDHASPLPRRFSDTHYPRLKRQKCRSFDRTQPPGISLAKSSTLSKSNVFLYKSSSFPSWKEHRSNIDEVRVIEMTASISSLIRGEPDTRSPHRPTSVTPGTTPPLASFHRTHLLNQQHLFLVQSPLSRLNISMKLKFHASLRVAKMPQKLVSSTYSRKTSFIYAKKGQAPLRLSTFLLETVS